MKRWEGCRNSSAARLGLVLAAGLPLFQSVQPAAGSTPVRVPAQNAPYAAVDQCIADEMRTVGAPAASLAIAENGQLTYVKGYGVRNRQSGGAVGPETMFRIGSTTKMMTAAAVLTLAEAGKIDLHAPLTTYLPELRLAAPWNLSLITPHHLLSHTSGMGEVYLLNSNRLLNSVSLTTWASDYLPRTALAAPPGTFWNYSNPGFSLAGYLVERVSGQSLDAYLREHVWRPAGMPLTTFSASEVMARGDFAWGYSGNQAIAPDTYPLPALAPAGLAFSTPTELVTWALTLMDGGRKVLRPESAAAMQTAYARTDWEPWERYGYGIFIDDYRDREDASQTVTVFQHSGGTPSWSSELYWVPERHMAVSILDSAYSSLNNSVRCVLREVAGIVPRSAAGLATAPSSWDAFAGTYAEMNQAQWDATIRVAREGDHLRLQRVEDDTALRLMNVYRWSFKEDADGDGRPDPGTNGRVFTFSGDKPDEGPIRWLRNRTQVSQRVGQFPASLALVGASCGRLELTPEIDMPRLVVRAAGLVAPGGQTKSRLPIRQDDPSDPSSASYKQNLLIRGEAGLFTVRLTPQAGDDLDLLLLHDSNDDGRFTYPDELAGVGWEGQGYELMTVTGRPSGRYQLWVHGWSVGGENHVFSLETKLVDGEQLRIASAPDSLKSGQTGTVTACAQGVENLIGPMKGLVELDYGSPPRRVRIPVAWTPGPHTVLLPLTYRGWTQGSSLDQ